MRRGEIWHVDLDPTDGREQRGRRYVLIVSPDEFNKATGTAIVVPITTGGGAARLRGLSVSLTGAGTNATGMVLCDQLRTMDLKARRGRRSETVPRFIVDDVLAKLAAILELS